MSDQFVEVVLSIYSRYSASLISGYVVVPITVAVIDPVQSVTSPALCVSAQYTNPTRLAEVCSREDFVILYLMDFLFVCLFVCSQISPPILMQSLSTLPNIL